MKKSTLLIAACVLVCGSAAAEAQMYVQPSNYTYTVSQPMYGPATTYAPASYAQPAYAPANYAQPAYTPAATYYAGNPCGQSVSYTACSPCCNSCCSPCGVNYVSASPCAPQAVYSPVTYAAPAPVACGPNAYVRRGLLGQPTLYVPGQPVRNALRFLSP